MSVEGATRRVVGGSDAGYRVGVHRFVADPRPFEVDVRMFGFV